MSRFKVSFIHFFLSVLFTSLLMTVLAHAQHIPTNPPSIRGGVSGFWFNPEQPAHGVQLEVLDNGRALLSWYTYRRDGSHLWLIGEGRIENDIVRVDLLEFKNGRPPMHWEEGDADVQVWGQAELTMQGCNQSVFSWNSGDLDFGTGQLELERFTSIQGTNCFAEEQFSQQFHFSFERRDNGFTGVFADLPADYDPAIYELDYTREQLPHPLSSYSGLRLTGHNRSDDLAMLVPGPIHGLLPETLYSIEIDAEFASDVPTNCVGVGGSPGEGLYVKLGAATVKPAAIVDNTDNWLRLNINYGIQSEEGTNARVAGNLANSQSCEFSPDADWELKALSTAGQKLFVETDANGTLWVFAGTDSAFEGFTQYYITTLRVRVEPRDF